MIFLIFFVFDWFYILLIFRYLFLFYIIVKKFVKKRKYVEIDEFFDKVNDSMDIEEEIFNFRRKNFLKGNLWN